MDYSHITRIDARLMPNRLNVWVCFGRTIHEQYLGPLWHALYFELGSIFGVVQRIENLHGAAAQRLSVLRAGLTAEISLTCNPRHRCQRLLEVVGDQKVNLVLSLIDAIQDQDIDPADASPDYWRLLHWRLARHRDPHLYTRAEHQLYLDQRRQPP